MVIHMVQFQNGQKKKKYHKGSAYDLCAVIEIFRNHTLALCKEHIPALVLQFPSNELYCVQSQDN